MRNAAVALIATLVLAAPSGAQVGGQRLVVGYPPYLLGMSLDQAVSAAGSVTLRVDPRPIGISTQVYAGRIATQVRGASVPANLDLEFFSGVGADLMGRLVVIRVTWIAGNLDGDTSTKLRRHAHYLREGLFAQYEASLITKDDLPPVDSEGNDRPGDVHLQDPNGNAVLLAHRPPYEVTMRYMMGAYARRVGLFQSPTPRVTSAPTPAASPPQVQAPTTGPTPSATPATSPSPAPQATLGAFFQIPQDPVVAFFDRIYVPVLTNNRVPADHDLAAFYSTHLAADVHRQVTSDQFVAYYRTVARRAILGVFFTNVFFGGSVSATYDIGEATYNDTRDQARFRVTMRVVYGSFLDRREQTRVVFAHAIREGTAWKVVLSPEVIADMRKLPVQRTGG